MPKLSAFTPLGMLKCTSKPSHGENIYRSIIAGKGGQVSVGDGSRAEATAYAQAMALARVRYTLEQAGAQQYGATCTDLLPVMEEEYKIVPGPRDTIAERQGVLTARQLIPVGCSRTNLVAALEAALGDFFVTLRTTPEAEIEPTPTNLGDQPMNLQRPTVVRKLVRLTQGVSTGLGAPQAVRYDNVAAYSANQAGSAVIDAPGSPASTVIVGDVLTIEPEIHGQTEVVTVTAVDRFFTSESDSVPRFTATFAKSHEPNALCWSGPFPAWTSNQRHALIAVTPGGIDPEPVRKGHDLMARMARAVSTWSIVETADGLTVGPFKVALGNNGGKIGFTTIGLVTL